MKVSAANVPCLNIFSIVFLIYFLQMSFQSILQIIHVIAGGLLLRNHLAFCLSLPQIIIVDAGFSLNFGVEGE